jgi:alpha-N-arabinofuranosidase
MRLLGVGNEQWGHQYLERYERFAKALKAKYPEIQLISSAGPSPADDRFKFAWPKLRELNADIIDEHCYAAPSWFLQNTHRYDQYDRGGPKVFMGEYAAQSVATVSPKNRNDLECALAEAAYMTGLERNADVVRMASYAPLFAHVDAWQWTPDLIWCDNLHVYGTPNYYVQQLFSQNHGDKVLLTRVQGPSDEGTNQAQPLFASATRADKGGEVILKLVNPTAQAQTASIVLGNSFMPRKQAQATVLAGGSPHDENSFAAPTRVAPRVSTLRGVSRRFNYECPPESITVLRMGSL